MSDRLFSGDVLFLQRLLSCCGLYSDTLDGDYGKHTSDAEHAFDERCRAIALSEGGVDGPSEANIRSLQLVAQPLARRSPAARCARCTPPASTRGSSRARATTKNRTRCSARVASAIPARA